MSQFAESQGWHRGVSGYMYHTVPAVLHAWFRHGPSYREAILDLIHAGGDSDTTAAILGGISGAGVGREGVPEEWLNRLFEWPRSVSWMQRLGQRVAQCTSPERPVSLSIPGLFLRNVFFFLIVVVHILRRCLPPY